jgi:hypothetical protein
VIGLLRLDSARKLFRLHHLLVHLERLLVEERLFTKPLDHAFGIILWLQ